MRLRQLIKNQKLCMADAHFTENEKEVIILNSLFFPEQLKEELKTPIDKDSISSELRRKYNNLIIDVRQKLVFTETNKDVKNKCR